jgi:hypothetical protein
LISPLDDGAASTYNWELAGACGLINGRDAALLLSAAQRFRLRCNGKSAGAGGLIDRDKMMLFLGMIDRGNTMLLLPCTGGLINGRVTMLLLSADQRFG